MRCDRVWINARLATLAPGREGLGIVEDGVVASLDGRIVYAGSAADAPTFETAETIDVDGRWITPGLIDPHTHLVFAGDRAHEFELRLAGASYEEIARAGGGIVSTMRATRAASEAELVQAALPRLDVLGQQPAHGELGEVDAEVVPRHPEDAAVLLVQLELLLQVVRPLRRIAPPRAAPAGASRRYPTRPLWLQRKRASLPCRS